MAATGFVWVAGDTALDLSNVRERPWAADRVAVVYSGVLGWVALLRLPCSRPDGARTSRTGSW